MKTKKAAAPTPVKRTLTTFRATHDPAVILPNKIKAALEAMRKEGGDEAYAYEVSDPEGAPFARLANVSGNQLNQYREMFKDFVVQVKDTSGSSRRGPRWVWFATAKAAKAARGE